MQCLFFISTIYYAATIQYVITEDWWKIIPDTYINHNNYWAVHSESDRPRTINSALITWLATRCLIDSSCRVESELGKKWYGRVHAYILFDKYIYGNCIQQMGHLLCPRLQNAATEHILHKIIGWCDEREIYLRSTNIESDKYQMKSNSPAQKDCKWDDLASN